MKIILELDENKGLILQTEGGWTINEALSSLEYAKLVFWENHKEHIAKTKNDNPAEV